MIGFQGRPAVVGVLAFALWLPARMTVAEENRTDAEPAPRPSSENAVAAGSLSPTAIATRYDTARGIVQSYIGYDGSRDGSVFVAQAQVSVFDHLGLTGGVRQFSVKDGSPRPFLRLSAGILSQDQIGVDVAGGVGYDDSGWEGVREMTFTLGLGRRIGPVQLLGNLTFGRELDEAQYHGDVRFAAVSRIAPRLYLGLDARYGRDMDNGRDDGDDEEQGILDVDFSLTAGPTLTYCIDRFALVTQVGMASMRYKGEPARSGALALVGVGATF